MPADIKAYRVFVASPGGLGPERAAFREVVQEYNEADAIERGVLFVPVGWETALGGVGRPQTFIDEDVRKSDYFVLILWDRWGSSPDRRGQGRYTSGTEEEYGLAMECLESADFPMRQVLAFFKAVEASRLSDPGQQLQKVLAFRRKLEAEKTLFFHTFDEVGLLKTILRRYMADWVRHHERGHVEKPRPPVSAPRGVEAVALATMPSVPSPTGAEAVRSQTLREAERLITEGRHTDAEMLLARAVVKGDDPEVLNTYGHFLQQVGRLTQAQEMYERLLDVSRQSRDDVWLAVAYGNLGVVLRTRGNLDRAEEVLQRSLEINERLRRREGMASDQGNLGLVYLARGDLVEARKMLELSLRLNREMKRSEAMASDYGALSLVCLQGNDLDGAERMLTESLRIYEDLGCDEGMANGYGSLGVVYRNRGDLGQAETMLHRSLDINVRLGRLEGMASDYGNLGLVHLERKQYDNAQAMLRKSLDINQRLGRLGSVASDYGSLGVVHRSRGDLDEAERLLRMGLEINERLGALCEMANQCADLGHVYMLRSEPERAKQLWTKARDLYARLGNSERVEHLEGLLRGLQDKA